MNNKKKLFVKDIKTGEVNQVNINEGLFDVFNKTKKFITDGNKQAFALLKNLSKDLKTNFKYKKMDDGSVNVYDISDTFITTITPEGAIDGGMGFSRYQPEDFSRKYEDIKTIFKNSMYLPESEEVKPKEKKKKKEKNPRYWSNKYWKKNSVTDILNEIIEPNSVDVNDLHMKDELCPEIWDGDKMKEDVRKVLLKNAIEFIKYCKIENQKFKDVILTGSLANYNYTDTSDIDIHILMDFNQISEDKEFVGEYFKNKKNLWSEAYPAKVYGHDVELYIQDISEEHTSTGVYSLINDEWLTKPIKKMIAIDTANVQLKSAHIMNAIDDLKDSQNNVDVINKVDLLMDKIKKMRQSGLDKEGEFSTENIVFKILRNSGYIKKLVDIKKDVMTRDLTLEGENNLNEGNILDFIKKHKNTGLLTLGIIVGAMASGVSADQIKQTGVGQEIIQKAEKFINDSKNDISTMINYNDAKAVNVNNDEIQN